MIKTHRVTIKNAYIFIIINYLKEVKGLGRKKFRRCILHIKKRQIFCFMIWHEAQKKFCFQNKTQDIGNTKAKIKIKNINIYQIIK